MPILWLAQAVAAPYSVTVPAAPLEVERRRDAGRGQRVQDVGRRVARSVIEGQAAVAARL
ncbi:MAG: hypothetical protein K0R01_3319 [Mycobacterium sp.]|nr:hypothetical protein [Mycobacterium sp.]